VGFGAARPKRGGFSVKKGRAGLESEFEEPPESTASAKSKADSALESVFSLMTSSKVPTAPSFFPSDPTRLVEDDDLDVFLMPRPRPRAAPSKQTRLAGYSKSIPVTKVIDTHGGSTNGVGDTG